MSFATGLAPIAKNFYQEDVIVGALSEEEVAMFRCGGQVLGLRGS